MKPFHILCYAVAIVFVGLCIAFPPLWTVFVGITMVYGATRKTRSERSGGTKIEPHGGNF
jgi:hypothetical protein